MADVIVYHNPDSMGYSASEVVEPVILTNKRVSKDAAGDQIWLITGEGKPRKFFLRGVFTARTVEPGDEEGFRTRVMGVNERFFSPMIELKGAWFEDLKRSQGNFAFGYQVVTDGHFIQGLEKAAESGTMRRRP
jgi:hypothetical protein